MTPNNAAHNDASGALAALIARIDDSIARASAGERVDPATLSREADAACNAIPRTAPEARALLPLLKQAIAALERLAQTLQDKNP